MILCHICLNPIIADDSNPSTLKVSGKEGISRGVLRRIGTPTKSSFDQVQRASRLERGELSQNPVFRDVRRTSYPPASMAFIQMMKGYAIVGPLAQAVIDKTLWEVD
jgi:hypothetical protein